MDKGIKGYLLKASGSISGQGYWLEEGEKPGPPITMPSHLHKAEGTRMLEKTCNYVLKMNGCVWSNECSEVRGPLVVSHSQNLLELAV